MTRWFTLGVLMLVSFSEASIFSKELDNQIKEGIEKTNASEKVVTKNVEEVNREINKVSIYFSRAVNESMVGGKKIYDDSVRKVEKIIIEKFEEGIDKDKEIGILLNLLENMGTTKNLSDGAYDSFKSCLHKSLAEKSTELEKLKDLFEFTEKFSAGFYNGLRAKIINCKDGKCVQRLVQAAETKRKILIGMFKKYVAEISNVSGGLREGHRNCLRDAEKNFSKILKKLENDMNYIPGTRGRGDLTDRFGSVILEV